MSKPLKPKRGTTEENDAYIGEAHEVTLDTQTHRLRTHDGATAGGFEHALQKDAVTAVTLNGQTLTVTKGDGSSEKFTTADTNTDTKVKQTVTTGNYEYPLLTTATAAQTATATAEARFAAGVTLNPSTKTITATTFNGNLSGNAATATSAGTCTGNAKTATTASACSGNAATATKLATARRITVAIKSPTSGGTGSLKYAYNKTASAYADFDGSAAKTITISLATIIPAGSSDCSGGDGCY